MKSIIKSIERNHETGILVYQIINAVYLKIRFTDDDEQSLLLYKRGNSFYIKPPFCLSKKIEGSIYNNLISMKSRKYVLSKTGNKYYIVNSNMTYNDFYDMYYNCFSQEDKNLQKDINKLLVDN